MSAVLSRGWVWDERRPLALVAAGFGVSRVLYYLLGIRFDTTTIRGPEFVDPQLLQHDLASSIWYLHTQPPLFNLYLGLNLKAFGSDYPTALHAQFVVIGLIFALSLYLLMRLLQVRRGLAVALTLTFAVSPAAVLYENWFYPDYVVAAALLVAALFVHRFAGSGRTRDVAAAVGILAGVVLSRTLFHLIYLLAVVALVWLLQPGRRRQVLVAACIPIGLCVAVYAKNWAQFGSFAADTCPGINTVRISTIWLTPTQRERLIRTGALSEFARVSPYALPFTRPDIFRREPRRGVALLDRPIKSNGAPNFDHAAYVRICDRYLQDSINAATHEPASYAHGLATAFRIFWWPASQYEHFDARNRDRIGRVDELYSRLLLGQPETATGPALKSTGLSNEAWILVLAYVAVFALGIMSLVRARSRRELSAPWATTVAVVGLSALYVIAAGVLFDSGENNRFRFLVDPLVLAALAGLVSDLRQRKWPMQPT